jgi:hypothetical protein
LVSMTTPPSKWSVAQVADWLASVGLEPEHVNLFTKQEINGEALFEMQTEHFTELGIPMGVRLRVQKHIAAFKDGAIDATSSAGFAAAAEVKPVPAPPTNAVAPVVVVVASPPPPVASPPPTTTTTTTTTTSNNSSGNSHPAVAASAPAATASSSSSSSSSANRGKLGRAYARLRGRAPSIKDIQVSDPREFQHVSGVQFDEGEFVGRGEVPESVKNVLEERGAKIRPGAKPPLPAKNAAAPAVAASATAVAAAAASGAAADVPAKPVPAAPKPHAGASASSGAQFKLAKVLFDYEAQTDEELTVTCGQQVRILEQDESGWWHAATADGATTGFVPGEFVEFISTAATESTQPPSEAAAETKPVGETTGVAATETVTATSTSGTTATTTAASSETTAKADGEEEKAKVSVEE